MNVHLKITETRSHTRPQIVLRGQWFEAAACEHLLRELRSAHSVCLDRQAIELVSGDRACTRHAAFNPPAGKKGKRAEWQQAVGIYVWLKQAAGEKLAGDCLRLLLVPGASAQPCWREHAPRLRRLGVFELLQGWCLVAGVEDATVAPVTFLDRVRRVLFQRQAA